MATIDEFSAIEMMVGTVLVAEIIPGADKLLRLEVDFGLKQVAEASFSEVSVTPDGRSEMVKQVEMRDVRQILSGIREYYAPEELIGKQFPFVTNLPARTMRGLESHGMILAVGLPWGVALLCPDKVVPPGSKLR